MRKILPFLFVLAFCFSSLAKASSQEILEDRKTEQNTSYWKGQIKRLSYGALALGASYAASSLTEIEEIPHTLSMIGAYYISTSLMTFVREGLNWYGESVAKAQHTPAGKGKRLTSQQSQKLDQTMQEKKRVFGVFLRQSQNLINATLKLSALYIHFHHTDSIDIVNTTLLASLLGGLIYNLNELRYTHTIGQARRDIPILGILDGYCESLLAHKLFSDWSNRPKAQWYHQDFQVSPEYILTKSTPIFPSEWAFHRLLQIHGDVQIVGNIFQIFRNTIHSFHSYLKQSPQIIERHIEKSVMAPSSLRQKKHPPLPQLLLPTDPLPLSIPSSRETPSSSLPQLLGNQEEQTLPPKKNKIKRRGTPWIQPAIAAPSLLAQAPAAVPTQLDKQRQDALTRIQKYRQSRTVKEAKIDQEIDHLLAFLSNAHLENSGHGKRAIILEFEAGNRFRILFEPPHEQNKASSNVYKGYRKTRVLDALQVGYLYGWNENKITEFMDTHHINRFYNFPLFLLHILWDRNHEA
ncbi:MAG: hypothetical protein J0H12_05380 [Candidatus Paracaedimonas acanthamoebae]|uniref:Uncharacterized protein n=1 Tax=Candidatus Paracaedimonas acanthamoebae TaxID=244581 RepID=A0A8J7TTX2_9PROT|nr:hypothetical protein [Candidatus Paracaedimonas acanthamoebae]